MSHKKLLTILVPTFNRLGFLVRLLSSLESELCGLEADVHLVIGDNGSNDGTAEFVKNFLAKNPFVSSFRLESNIGPDRIFLELFSRVKTHYFWIISDDDMPRQGLIGKLLQKLYTIRPTLLYLESYWAPNIYEISMPRLQELELESFEMLDYARKINIRTTFVSSWVVNSLSMRSRGLDSFRLKKVWVRLLFNWDGFFHYFAEPLFLLHPRSLVCLLLWAIAEGISS
ncbi:glycosyltransferase family 2 protein [Cyanobium sp. ATX-6F1]|uniref:glycosyltransferase family 2 protein n=1 Tax=Cyanobium sp. ATX-6F1 TaxID=3137388 RepID=UPI0039BE16DE